MILGIVTNFSMLTYAVLERLALLLQVFCVMVARETPMLSSPSQTIAGKKPHGKPRMEVLQTEPRPPRTTSGTSNMSDCGFLPVDRIGGP